MGKSIDITKMMNDFNIWLNLTIKKVNLWINNLPNNLNLLIEKIKNYPPDKQAAVGSIVVGFILILISIILFIL